MTGKELQYIAEAYSRHQFSGDGFFTAKCNKWLKNAVGCHSAFLTHSCTAALEMASMLINITEGDEVIMPSYTFVSTANAFVLRGAIPVFVDIRSDTLNIDENLVEAAISEKTKAIVPVHYAGVGCEMDAIMELARKYNLKVIEDAAQALQSTYRGKALGSIGDLGAYSFHETKNIISGEGGAIIVNDSVYKERAEIIRDKGTNRKKFLRGETDKYTWIEKGSSYLPGEIIAAFLFAQMENADNITQRRLHIWNLYHQLLEDHELSGILRRPIIPAECKHNAHMYYILLSNNKERDSLLTYLKATGIHSVFHYIPLHSSPAGEMYSRYIGDMINTKNISETLIRLPMYTELSDDEVSMVVDAISSWVKFKK